MTLRVVLGAPSVSTEAAAEFRSTARLIFSGYAALRTRLGIPASRVTAILADDFVGEVQQRIPFGGVFEAERVGGARAIAKNLCLTDDCSEVAVVFDAESWRGPSDDVDRLFRATIIGHELAHVIQARASRASGAMDGVELPSVTPYEGFRSASRILANEYRADALAEVVVGAMASVEINGEPRPFATWFYRDRSYINALVGLLSAAHPSWPDLVDRYRNWEIPIEEMFGTLASEIDQTLTLLVHAQAFADAAGGTGDLLGKPEIEPLAAVRLYLAEPLKPFIDLIRDAPALASLSDTRDLEGELVRVGLGAHLEIYRRLGITPRDLPRPDVWIDVSEPIR
jgi:hypothetical protein